MFFLAKNMKIWCSQLSDVLQYLLITASYFSIFDGED